MHFGYDKRTQWIFLNLQNFYQKSYCKKYCQDRGSGASNKMPFSNGDVAFFSEESAPWLDAYTKVFKLKTTFLS